MTAAGLLLVVVEHELSAIRHGKLVTLSEYLGITLYYTVSPISFLRYLHDSRLRLSLIPEHSDGTGLCNILICPRVRVCPSHFTVVL